MIKTPTVFVLGAGASIPYGFPSGADLRREVVQYLAKPLGSAAGIALSASRQFTTAQIQIFANAFSRSNMASIDAFLAKRLEFADVGKAAIAAVLGAKEKEETLFSDEIEDHWYRLLWNALMSDTREPADIARNEIRFVTFNYDRSLEHFLQQSIKHSWGVQDVRALEILKQIPMLHVYGSLGPFHFQKEPGYRPYGEPLPGGGLELAAASIHIIPEARKDDVFVEAKKWFAWAKRIYFLGFGFDPLNIERMGLESVMSSKRQRIEEMPAVYATVLGRTKLERNRDRLRLLGSEPWEVSESNCSEILRNTPVLFG